MLQGEMSQERIKEKFEYKNDCLVWRDHRQKKRIGTQAGYVINNHWYVKIKQTLYPISKIVYALHHDVWPNKLHFIDDNPMNITIDNLQIASVNPDYIIEPTHTGHFKATILHPEQTVLGFFKTKHPAKRAIETHYQKIKYNPKK